ncbi:glycosyltransferase [Bacillus sp. NPDC094106]|uniref:glycosyltransferase n=1 Tax=Bacillus sp. NPDC094106 TaxID=3363949 RepID=UPI003809A2D9
MSSKSKQRILFVLPSLQGGGAEKVVLNVINKIDRNKYHPVLFLFVNEGVYLNKLPSYLEVNYALEAGKSFTKNSFKVINKLKKQALQSSLIVSSLELTTTYFSIIAGLMAKKPTVGWIHIDIAEFHVSKKFSHKILLKMLYPHLRSAIAVSEGVEEAVIKVIPKLKGKTEVIYNPLPVKEIREYAEEPNSFVVDSPLIIAAGRLTYQKSFDYLIRCHARLISKGVNHRLVILGEGEEKVNLLRLIKELNMEKSVFLAGFQDNPYSWIKKADIFVLSSRFEGFGMVIAEAMALGIPIISTDCPSGPAEILEDGKYGVLVKSQDENSMCIAIESMLLDKGKIKFYQHQSLERIKEFNEDNVIPKFDSLFGKIIN